MERLSLSPPLQKVGGHPIYLQRLHFAMFYNHFVSLMCTLWSPWPGRRPSVSGAEMARRKVLAVD
eukprot:2088426-Pyramimonas_sp.AAC.1